MELKVLKAITSIIAGNTKRASYSSVASLSKGKAGWEGAKILRVMKLTAIILFAACLQVNAKGYSQITLSEKNVTLQKVFTEIKKQTGYTFWYEQELLQNAPKVDINVTNASLEQVLQIVFKDQALTYSIIEKTVVVKEKPPTTGLQFDDIPLSPPTDITGRITNNSGEPLAGANIIIKRTGHGTITDANGKFTLKNVNPDDIIIISYVGYKKLSIKVEGGKEFPLVMEVATNELDKVVIQAYGTTSQRLATGNIATVTSKEIERQPVINPLQALQGRVAGLVVTQTSGYASAPFKVEIRGRNLIGNVPSDPLYIIDGVPLTILEAGSRSTYQNGSTGFVQNGYLGGPAGGQSPFFSINPADIESITVLKDADATAIYGSRGANGVIIITTKKGSASKTTLNINVSQGINIVTRHYNLMNTQQYLQMRREALANDGIIPDAGNAYDLLVWDTSRYTDWQKYLWGNTGQNTSVQVSLSGGNKQTTFRIGAGYNYLTDISATSGANRRGSLQFNLSHKSLDQRANITFSSDYSVADVNMIDIYGLVLAAPNAPPVFDSKGNLNYAGWTPINDQFPFAAILQPYSAKTNFLNCRIQLKYEVLKGLTFESNFGYSNATISQQVKVPIASLDPMSNPTGASEFAYNNHVNWIIEPQIHYNNFINKGKLDVLFGLSTQGTSFDGNAIIGSGYSNDNLLGSISNAPIKDAFDTYSRYKYAALFSRINYNWDDRYIIDLSMRRDGSSRFGPGKQFGNFGAIGVAWIFSEEKWIKNHFKFLSLGKIRGSYGTTGNDQIGDYGYLTRWSASRVVPYQGTASYVPLQHANPYYQWQVNRKLEFAMDLNFLKDRFNFEIAWYQNRCNNQLLITSIPIITGFGNVIANFPADVQNRGIEFVFNSKIIDKKDINWDVSFNVSHNQNKIIAFPNLLQSPYAYNYYVGKPIHIAQLLRNTGIDPQTGQYTFQDKNKDGIISNDLGPTNDLYINDLSPKYFGGGGTDFRYRNWGINVFFHFKNQIGNNAFANLPTPGAVSNAPVQVLNRWQKPGDKTDYARFTTNPTLSDAFFRTSEASYTDASFIRLTNLVIYYNLPDRWCKRAKISNCRIFMQAQNSFVITKYQGVDPETQSFAGMPPQKIFTGGIEINL